MGGHRRLLGHNFNMEGLAPSRLLQVPRWQQGSYLFFKAGEMWERTEYHCSRPWMCGPFGGLCLEGSAGEKTLGNPLDAPRYR